MSEAIAVIGDNQPPSPIEILWAGLSETNHDLVVRTGELLASCERAPATIADEDMAGKFRTQIKLVNAAVKEAEARHKTAKQPHLDAGRAVDSFFKRGIQDPLKAAANQATDTLTAYDSRKAAEERRRREEAERLAREEAEQLARQARQVADLADTDAGLEIAIAAEEQAVEAEQVATEAGQAARASSAELSRGRSDSGAMSSLHSRWVGEITNASELDLEKLRPHLSLTALQQALTGYVRAGGRKLDGARIEEKARSTVR